MLPVSEKQNETRADTFPLLPPQAHVLLTGSEGMITGMSYGGRSVIPVDVKETVHVTDNDVLYIPVFRPGQ